MKTHSIGYNFMMNMILKVSSFVFPLITFPYVSRVLGVDGNGKVVFATSLISYFSMFACLGIPTYGVKVCAQYREDKKQLSRTAQELTLISVFTTFVVYLLLVLTIISVPKLFENREAIMVSSASIILTSLGMEWFLQALEQYHYMACRRLLFKAISLALMFVFVRDSSDYVLYVGIMVIGTVGSNVLNLIHATRYIYLRPVGGYDFKRHLKPILILFLLSVSAAIYTNLDAVMLGFMKNDTEVGLYNAAIKVKSTLVGVVTALGTVLLPRISYYLKNGHKDEFNRIIRKSFQFVIMFAMPLSAYFVVLARDTILLLAGSGYEGADVAMMIITPTIFLIGLSNIIGIQILIPMDKEKYTVVSTICGACIDVVLNIIFIPRWGAAGAAFSTLLAEIVVLLIQVYYLRDRIKEWLDLRDHLKVVIVTAVATIVLIFVKIHIDIAGAFSTLILTAIVFWGIVACGFILLKESIVDQYLMCHVLKKIKKNKKNKEVL